MRKFRVVIEGTSYEVVLHKKEGSEIEFSHQGNHYLASIEPMYERAAFDSTAVSPTSSYSPPKRSTITTDANHVVAPMPGVVVSVAVKKGDRVKAGQTVCVVEAMKMENNIPSPRDATIDEVCVSAGKEVGNGEVLIKLT